MQIGQITIVGRKLYGRETWSLTLREERRLRVFEKRMLGRIFGVYRDENGEWRRLHNQELHSQYPLPNIARAVKSRKLRRQYKQRNRRKECFQNFRTQTYRKETFREAARSGWDDSIRIYLKLTDNNARNWFDSVQDKDYQRTHVKAILNHQVL